MARPRRRKEIRIQDGFLFESLKEERPVALVLVSGRVVQGRIKRFDRYVLQIEDGAREILVYKHAIAGLGIAARKSD